MSDDDFDRIARVKYSEHGRCESAPAPGLEQRQQEMGHHGRARARSSWRHLGNRVLALNRVAGETDLGNATCYLYSDEASMVTGVCMEVHGNMRVRSPKSARP